MLFGTHLIGGYIAARVSKMSVALVVLGAALPDVIDKPLGILEIAPHYHSIGHSVFTVLFFLLVAVKLRYILPVIIGWSVHIFQDALHIFINRGIEKTTFVFYPLILPDKPEITDGSVGFITNFWSNYLWTTGFYVEFIFWGVAFWLMYSQREKIQDWIKSLN
jgi:hypothetical protein